MKAITLRNLPPELERAIHKKAREKKLSLNKAVLALLEETAGRQNSKHKVRYHELDPLCGSWSKEEADQFDRALVEQRRIDLKLWE